MNQCDTCRNWIMMYKDPDGKKHYGCQLTGYRSRGKWKDDECPAFKLNDGQTTLEALSIG